MEIPTKIGTMLLALLRDDSAQATMEYAVLATAFGVLMIGAMAAVQHAAGNDLSTTQNGLSSAYLNP